MSREKPKARLMKGEKDSFSDKEKLILYWRQDPVTAAKDIFGFDLIWLQRIALRAMWNKPFVLLNISRGVSKSFLFALYAALRAMLYSEMQIGIVTPFYRQVSLYIFDQFKKWSHKSPLFRSSIYGKITVSPSASRIHFKNGSLIEGLPIGNNSDGSAIRGQRYHDILVDEYAQHREDIVKKVIRPMGNIEFEGRVNKLHIASTPYFKWNHFWPQYLVHIKLCIEDPTMYELVEFDYRDLMNTKPSPLVPVVPYKISQHYIKLQQMDQPKEMFAMENLARFPDETTGFFSSQLIDFASPRNKTLAHPDGEVLPEIVGQDSPRVTYYLGIDVGRVLHGSNFVCGVIKYNYLTGRKQMVYMESLNGGTYQEMIAVIRGICQKFSVSAIGIGQGGGGLTLKDYLAEEYVDPDTGKIYPRLLDVDDEDQKYDTGLRIVHMVVESMPLNNYMYSTLKADLEHGRVTMPLTMVSNNDLLNDNDFSPKQKDAVIEISKMKTEMLAIQAEPTTAGFKFVVDENFGKDRITAFVIGNHVANQVNKAPVEEEEEWGEGFWITSVGGRNAGSR